MKALLLHHPHTASRSCLRMPFVLAVAFSCCVGLLGCSVGPDYERPKVPHQEEWKATAFTEEGFTWLPVGDESTPSVGTWWDLFHDSTLSTLLSNVRMGAYDIRTAYYRMVRAQASLSRSYAPFFPTITGNPEFNRSQFSNTEGRFPGALVSNYAFPFRLSYEIDLWGKVRRTVERDAATSAARGEDLEFVVLGVTSEAANHYFTLQALEQELRILEKTQSTRAENLRLVKARVEVGTGDELDLARAESELGVVTAEMERVKGLKENTLLTLATLEGQVPEKFDLKAEPLACSPPAVPELLPSELLMTRPDIRAAEEEVKAASADIGVTIANFFPSFNLNALWGGSSLNSSRLFDTDSRIWTLNPGINIPIFQGGQNLALRAQAEASFQEASERYKQTVLNAIREVESAITFIRQRERESAELEKSVGAAQRTTHLSRVRYEEGLVSYFDVVDAERQALDLERSKNNVCRERYLATVELIRALGAPLGQEALDQESHGQEAQSRSVS